MKEDRVGKMRDHQECAEMSFIGKFQDHFKYMHFIGGCSEAFAKARARASAQRRMPNNFRHSYSYRGGTERSWC